jgi:hypothetical protein
MHGPAFDDAAKTVNRDVPEADVVAFEQAGYVKGRAPEAPDLKSGQSDPKPVSGDDSDEARTKAELADEASSKGIQLKSGMSKAEMIEALSLESRTKAELLELAASKGLEVSGNKLDVINQIVAAG